MRLPARSPRAVPLRAASSQSGAAAALPRVRSGRRKEEIVMLHAVHLKKGAPQASSVYCQWICVELEGASRLVAVWIDSNMTAFEKEFASATVSGHVAKRQAAAPEPRELGAEAKTGRAREAWDVSEAQDGELQESEDGLVANSFPIEGKASGLQRMPRS